MRYLWSYWSSRGDVLDHNQQPYMLAAYSQNAWSCCRPKGNTSRPYKSSFLPAKHWLSSSHSSWHLNQAKHRKNTTLLCFGDPWNQPSKNSSRSQSRTQETIDVLLPGHQTISGDIPVHSTKDQYGGILEQDQAGARRRCSQTSSRSRSTSPAIPLCYNRLIHRFNISISAY
jgi:hypothetical protein